MAKKNRTGLQSEVSHIFAGVPIPKKKRSHSQHPEKKQESEETTKTPAEQLPSEQLPVEEHPAQSTPEQPDVTKIHAEQPDVESRPAESSDLKPTIEQEQAGDTPAEETPTEQLMAPQPYTIEPGIEELSAPETPVKEPTIVETPPEEPTFKQPPVIEPSMEQPAVPLSQTMEVPELEEPVEAIKEPSSAPSLKTDISKRTAAPPTRKVPTRPKDKHIKSKSRTSSRRQTIMVILAISLLILLFFLLVKPFDNSLSNNTASNLSVQPTSQSSNTSNAGSFVIEWSPPEIYPTGIRDPMAVNSAQEFFFETDTPVVTGISITEDQKIAIISTGKFLQEGEEIFGWKVMKINPNSVVFEKNGRTLTRETKGEE